MAIQIKDIKRMRDNSKSSLEGFYKDITWYEEKQKSFLEYTKSKEYRDEFGNDDPSINNQYHWLSIGEYHKYFEESEIILGRKPTVYDLHGLHSWILRELLVEFRDALDYFANVETVIFEKNRFGNPEIKEPGYKDIMSDNVWEALEKERLKIEYAFYDYICKLENVDDMPTGKEIIKTTDEYFNNKKKDIELIDWQIHLINKNLLYEDGKRVRRGILPDVVTELVIFTKQNYDYKWIQEHFLKDDYSRFSKSTCEQARTYANTH